MYDLIVIGGGPAGVTAALRGRELGAETLLVERGRLGGTCTNDGCAPTRVLAKTARLARDARQFAQYGLRADLPSVDFAAVIDRTQQVIYRLQEKKQLIDHLQSVGATTLHDVGSARFLDEHTLGLPDGRTLQGRQFIVCAGGSPRRLSFPGAEHTLTHSDVWLLRHLPRSLIIVGSGATGCQLATIFDAFGTRVTILELAPRILINEDELVARVMGEQFEQTGIRIITGIEGVQSIAKQDGELHLTYTHTGQAQQLAAEAVILSVGWPGNLPDLNLSAAGVETERAYIRVNDYLQTSAPHIFAAGDITGKMMLVQSASSQGRLAAENALLPTPDIGIRHQLVPHGGFTDPEYGSVGMTEQEARRTHPDCAVSVVPYADLDRAVIDDHTVGFCKIIVDRQSRLMLGGHVVGEQAVEIVQLLAAGMAADLTIEQLANLELAYPTYTAIVGLAAREVVRQLNLVPVSAQWRALKPVRGAEWERESGA